MAEENFDLGGESSPRDEAMKRRRGSRLTLEQRDQRTAIEMAILASGGELDKRAESSLSDIRERDATIHLSDLSTYFDAKRGDTPEKFKKERTRYEGLSTAALEVASGEEIPQNRQEALLGEVEHEVESWMARSRDDDLTDAERRDDELLTEIQIAKANTKIFTQFRNLLYERFNTPNDDRMADEPLDAATSQETMKRILPSPEEFPQYDVDTKHATESLEKAAAELSPDEFTGFYSALTKDIMKSEESYEDNPKWLAKKAIVESAINFYFNHQNDPESKTENIYITVTDGGTVHTGWTQTPVEGKNVQEYVLDPNGRFNPGAPDNDTKSLSYHAYNSQQFDILILDALPGIREGLQKLEAGEEIDPQEALYMKQMIDRFGGEHTEKLLKYWRKHVLKKDESGDGDNVSATDEVVPEGDDDSGDHKTRQFMQNGRRLRKRYYI